MKQTNTEIQNDWHITEIVVKKNSITAYPNNQIYIKLQNITLHKTTLTNHIANSP